jgi:hypothetical protein
MAALNERRFALSGAIPDGHDEAWPSIRKKFWT